jgi:hypothetical protein
MTIIALTLTVPLAAGQEILDQEDKIKATFILNFVLYTSWTLGDIDEFAGPGIDVCTLQGRPFVNFMNEVLEEKKQTMDKMNKVNILSVTADEADNCDVLFIPSEYSRSLEASNFSRENLLLIGEYPGFATSGGIINFFLENDNVKFEINYEELLARKLSMNSQVLRLAKIVP